MFHLRESDDYAPCLFTRRERMAHSMSRYDIENDIVGGQLTESLHSPASRFSPGFRFWETSTIRPPGIAGAYRSIRERSPKYY